MSLLDDLPDLDELSRVRVICDTCNSPLTDSHDDFSLNRVLFEPRILIQILNHEELTDHRDITIEATRKPTIESDLDDEEIDATITIKE